MKSIFAVMFLSLLVQFNPFSSLSSSDSQNVSLEESSAFLEPIIIGDFGESASFKDMKFDKSGRLYVVGTNYKQSGIDWCGAYVLDSRKSAEWENICENSSVFSAESIGFDKVGNLLLGSTYSLDRWDGEKWKDDDKYGYIDGDVSGVVDLDTEGLFVTAGGKIFQWNNSSARWGSIGFANDDFSVMVPFKQNNTDDEYSFIAGGYGTNRLVHYDLKSNTIGYISSDGIDIPENVNTIAVNSLYGYTYVAGSYIKNRGNQSIVMRKNQGEWEKMGDGITKQPIFDITTNPYKNELIVCGDFSQIGGVTANGIARWDGNNWYSLPQISENKFKSISQVEYDEDGSLFVAGRLESNRYVIVKYPTTIRAVLFKGKSPDKAEKVKVIDEQAPNGSTYGDINFYNGPDYIKVMDGYKMTLYTEFDQKGGIGLLYPGEIVPLTTFRDTRNLIGDFSVKNENIFRKLVLSSPLWFNSYRIDKDNSKIEDLVKLEFDPPAGYKILSNVPQYLGTGKFNRMENGLFNWCQPSFIFSNVGAYIPQFNEFKPLKITIPPGVRVEFVDEQGGIYIFPEPKDEGRSEKIVYNLKEKGINTYDFEYIQVTPYNYKVKNISLKKTSQQKKDDKTVGGEGTLINTSYGEDMTSGVSVSYSRQIAVTNTVENTKSRSLSVGASVAFSATYGVKAGVGVEVTQEFSAQFEASVVATLEQSITTGESTSEEYGFQVEQVCEITCGPRKECSVISTSELIQAKYDVATTLVQIDPVGNEISGTETVIYSEMTVDMALDGTCSFGEENEIPNSTDNMLSKQKFINLNYYNFMSGMISSVTAAEGFTDGFRGVHAFSTDKIGKIYTNLYQKTLKSEVESKDGLNEKLNELKNLTPLMVYKKTNEDNDLTSFVTLSGENKDLKTFLMRKGFKYVSTEGYIYRNIPGYLKNKSSQKELLLLFNEASEEYILNTREGYESGDLGELEEISTIGYLVK